MEASESGWAARRPHPALRALVHRYCGYRRRGVTLPVHRGLPSEHVTFIVSLEEPVRVIGMPGGSGRGVGSRPAFASGLHTGPAARVVRFGRATGLLRTRPVGGLGQVAHSWGYVDQAHLTNEFNALAGCTPGTWIGEELPFLQDG